MGDNDAVIILDDDDEYCNSESTEPVDASEWCEPSPRKDAPSRQPPREPATTTQSSQPQSSQAPRLTTPPRARKATWRRAQSSDSETEVEADGLRF